MKGKLLAAMVGLVFTIGVTGFASATPFSIMIGDDDGYGQGIANGGNGTWASFTPQDWRSPAEQAATNGAQATDIYGVLWDSPSTPVNIVFNLSGTLTSAVLTVDMADAQAIPIGIGYNGVAQSSWVYPDGYQATAVRTYVLDAAAIANANAAGAFILNLGTNAPVYDYLAFDYFKLEGNYASAAVPEPSTFILIAAGLAGLGLLRRRAVK